MKRRTRKDESNKSFTAVVYIDLSCWRFCILGAVVAACCCNVRTTSSSADAWGSFLFLSKKETKNKLSVCLIAAPLMKLVPMTYRRNRAMMRFVI